MLIYKLTQSISKILSFIYLIQIFVLFIFYQNGWGGVKRMHMRVIPDSNNFFLMARKISI